MKKNFKERFFSYIENTWKKEKIKRREAQKRQARIKKELKIENKNLSKKERIKKLIFFSLAIILYIVVRCGLRAYSGKEVFRWEDILFGLIVIGLYALYIFKWAKEYKDSWKLLPQQLSDWKVSLKEN